METQSIRIKIPPFYTFLAKPKRYKSIHGGRGAARSWSVARILAGITAKKPLRILCGREYQTSIKESVHQTLSDQIDRMGLSSFYTITRDSIRSSSGGEFIFKGLHFNSVEIKSIEGIDICWIEEAQSITNETWEYLIPTIRKDPPGGPFGQGSEIWLTWNTGEIDDPTYQRFVVNPPDDCVSKKATFRDNPYFPEVLEKERLYLKRVDPDAYDHVWEGNPRSISDACVFKNKFVVEDFTPGDPKNTIFYYGADWGFATDPTTLTRCFIVDNHLYIDYEAYGVGVELNEIPELFSVVPGYNEWMIRADSARPETISYLKNTHGLKITSCDKWADSVKDGIAYLRKFEMIHIHPRCKHVAQEFKGYSYKKDPKSGEILPIIVDKSNHTIDSIRYSLDKRIKGKLSFTDFV